MTPLLIAGVLLLPAQVHGPGDADDWISRGRTLLEEGRATEAQDAFEQAAELEPESLRSRMWILRSWMEQGRINDSLDATDALRTGGASGVELDYLYGMAWFLAAEKKLEQNADGPSLRRNVSDAVDHLRLATDANPERFGDALYPLAKVAWMSQRLDVARRAAVGAAERDKGNARAHHLLGRIALSQREIAAADPAREEEALAHERVALESLLQAATLLDLPPDGPTGRENEALLSETHLQLLNLHLRGRDFDRAGAALASAVSWDPDRLDYQSLFVSLPAEVFTTALTEGSAAFERHFGKERRIAPVHWWLGYARFRAGLYSAAERSLLVAVASGNPETRSAWYYIARLRYVQRNYGGAVAALRAFWDAEPTELLSSLESDGDFTGPMIAALGEWCAAEGRLVDATILLELAAEVSKSSVSWQRLGSYLADEGARWREREGPSSKTAARCIATALRAFDRAHLVAPDAPVHMLDLARHLHLVLHTDLERARKLYERARVEAGRRLVDPSVDLATRTRLSEIRRVARENLDRLAARTAGE